MYSLILITAIVMCDESERMSLGMADYEMWNSIFICTQKSKREGFCVEKWDIVRLVSVNKYYKLSVLWFACEEAAVTYCIRNTEMYF